MDALENGIPSHDCIARVMARIESSKLTECFVRWARSITELPGGEVVAIDGKTARRSYRHNDKRGRFMSSVRGRVKWVYRWDK